MGDTPCPSAALNRVVELTRGTSNAYCSVLPSKTAKRSASGSPRIRGRLASDGPLTPKGCRENSAQCLVQIHDQVVGILNPDRNANKRRRDAQPQPFFLRDVRMGHRRRMRGERLRTTQAHRELDHLKPIQDGKGFGLTPLHIEAESGAWTLALALEDRTIGMAPWQESQVPDRRDLRMGIEEGCDLARAFRCSLHSELQGLK